MQMPTAAQVTATANALETGLTQLEKDVNIQDASPTVQKIYKYGIQVISIIGVILGTAATVMSIYKLSQ
jgi:hypothetical protein